jgi:hypothetical protein
MGSENTVDGPRTSLSAVDERMPGTLRVSRVLPELFSSGVVLPDSVVDPPTRFRLHRLRWWRRGDSNS